MKKKQPNRPLRSARKARRVKELDAIDIRGAREHNLKNIHVRLPKKNLIVFTGVSGSGKSSLAFDTIFAEGQRRYVESLSAYARQFIGQMEKPRYDTIRGLSPTIAIEQKAASKNPRSTVGTITEIYDYLRVLFARVGEQYCYKCGQKVGRGRCPGHGRPDLWPCPRPLKNLILAPIVENRKGEHRDRLRRRCGKRAFARVRIDGVVQDIEDVQQPGQTQKAHYRGWLSTAWWSEEKGPGLPQTPHRFGGNRPEIRPGPPHRQHRVGKRGRGG
jgi:excinuclease ABC subunit A